MKYGYDGSELDNPHFKKKGYLKNNDKYKKFTDKVDSICISWEKLRKKKGEEHPYYIIKGLKQKDEVELISEDKRATSQLDVEDEWIAMYFYDCLVKNKMNLKPLTLNAWAIWMGAIDPRTIIDEGRVKELFNDEYYEQDISFIHNHFKEYIKGRNEAVTSKSMKILKLKGLIDVDEVYIGIDLHSRYIKVSHEVHNAFQDEMKLIVGKYDRSINDYRFFMHREGYEDMKKDVETWQQETGYITTYKAYDIQVKVASKGIDITFQEFQSTYNKKMINYISDLQDKEFDKSGKLILYFSKRFRKYNLLSILKASNWSIHIEEELINKFKPTYQQIYELMMKRDCNGFIKTLSERWKMETLEVEMLLSGEIIKKELPKSESQDVTQSDVQNATQIPYTLEELLGDVEIPNYTYIPFNTVEETKHTYEHNNQDLNDAVEMIRLAFGNTYKKVA